MKIKYLLLIFFTLTLLIVCSCSKNESARQEPEELMEVTGIVSSYDNDVMYVTVLRTHMTHPLRITDDTQMDIFAAPKDTVLLVYTGYLGYPKDMPVIKEIHTRPYHDPGSKVVNLKELKNSGELITRP